MAKSEVRKAQEQPALVGEGRAPGTGAVAPAGAGGPSTSGRQRRSATATAGGSGSRRHRAALAPAAVPRSALRQAFLDRSTDLVARMADSAPEEVLAAALAKASPLDTVATAMSAFVFEERALDRRDRVLAAARARGAQYMEAVLERAGGAYTADQLAAVLGKAGGRQTVAVGRKTHLYFGLPTAAGAFAYPKLQVTSEGQLLGGLREFLDAFTLPDPWMQLSMLLEPSPRLAGRSPLDALRAGDVAGAAAVAAAYGSHGA